MPNSDFHFEFINPRLSEDEKLVQVNEEWERLYTHFKRKAASWQIQYIQNEESIRIFFRETDTNLK